VLFCLKVSNFTPILLQNDFVISILNIIMNEIILIDGNLNSKIFVNVFQMYV